MKIKEFGPPRGVTGIPLDSAMMWQHMVNQMTSQRQTQTSHHDVAFASKIRLLTIPLREPPNASTANYLQFIGSDPTGLNRNCEIIHQLLLFVLKR